MAPHSQPLPKVRKSYIDLQPPVRPAERLDLDIASAIRAFLPSTHNVEDLPSLPAINMKTRRFRRSEGRRLISSPAFLQSKGAMGLTTTFSASGSNSTAMGAQVLSMVPSLHRSSCAESTSAASDSSLHLSLHSHLSSNGTKLSYREPPLEKAAPNSSSVTIFDSSFNISAPSLASTASGCRRVSPLDDLRLMNPSACDQILSLYLKDSSQSSASSVYSSVSPSEASSNALNDVFEEVLHAYDSVEDFSQYDSLFDDEKYSAYNAPIKSDSSSKDHATEIPSIPKESSAQANSIARKVEVAQEVATKDKTSVPELPVCPKPGHSDRPSSVFYPPSATLRQRVLSLNGAYDYSLDMCADYDKSRFMIPEEDRIHPIGARSRHSHYLEKSLWDQPKKPEVAPSHASRRFSSGPLLKVKRLFSAH